jgi:hypothetical protein
MKLTTIAATVFAAGLSTAGAAFADSPVTGVQNICEVSGGGVNTVFVHVLGSLLLDYTFKTLPAGQTYVFPATIPAQDRKFALPAGTYQLSVKMPNTTPVASYGPSIVVRPFQVVGGACVFPKLSNVGAAVGRTVN